jgi:hypothetical protein
LILRLPAPAGAKASQALYSVIESVKENGLDPAAVASARHAAQP